jgi:hypothetical protein
MDMQRDKNTGAKQIQTYKPKDRQEHTDSWAEEPSSATQKQVWKTRETDTNSHKYTYAQAEGYKHR